MPIKASSARHVEALIADLQSADAITREAAIARLLVIGVRAVDRLGLLARDTAAAPGARTAALRALEGISDDRALEIALSAATDAHADVAEAAVAVVRTFLASPHDLPAVDALTAIALDRARADGVREAALQALGGLSVTTLGPVVEALLTDPSAQMRAIAKGAREEPNTAAPVAQEDWLNDDSAEVPDDPAAVRAALTSHAADIGLPRLHGLIERIRGREQDAAGARRQEWMRARAAAHVALATRGSRLALYDLRESLDAATEPLPVEFLAALTVIGDASCLEPLAAAWARRSDMSTKSDWWHRHLAEAFQAIVTREAITRRHAAAKKIEKRWPEVAELWPPASAARQPAARKPEA